MNSVDRRCLRPLASAAMALFLSSCATPRTPVRTYVEPIGVPTARLLTRGSVGVADIYGVIVFDDAEHCSGPRIAGAGNASRPPKATQLEAGRLATLDFVGIRSDKSACRIRWSFTPTAGKTYLVAGLMSPTGCSARVLDATDPDRPRADNAAQRRNLGGSTCSPVLARPASPQSTAEQGVGEAVLRPGATAEDLQGLIGQ